MTPQAIAQTVADYLSGQTYPVTHSVSRRYLPLRKAVSKTNVEVFIAPVSFGFQPLNRFEQNYERSFSIGIIQKAHYDDLGSYDDAEMDKFVQLVERVAYDAANTPTLHFLSVDPSDYFDNYELEAGYFTASINIQFRQLGE